MTGRPHFGQIRSVASSVTSDFFTLLFFSSTSFANGSKKSRTTGTHSTSPAAIRSRSSSIRTVKPVSTMSGKCSLRKSVTTKPTSSGMSARPSLRTYRRSTRVEIVGAYVDGRPRKIRGPDGLVCFLRALRPRLVVARLLDRVRRAKFLRDDLARLMERALGDVERVGTHIRDETDRRTVADRDAFIELLREDHRLLH